MLVLGIVGGIASGKSLVSRELERLGAEVIDADRLGHQVLLDPAVEALARERWGAAVFDAQGRLDRRLVAQQVFAPGQEGERERQFWEQVTHPRISARMRDRISELAALGDTDVVVLDAALLLEAGWHEYCDQILFIDTPIEQRLERAKSRNWTAADFAAREAAQIGLEEKRAQAQVVIDNAGSAEKTLAQVQRFWKTLPELE